MQNLALTSQQADALRALESGDWRTAHPLVQDDESPLGCWLHGIVHILEGDHANARYWYRRAKRAWPQTVDAAAELRAAARSK